MYLYQISPNFQSFSYVFCFDKEVSHMWPNLRPILSMSTKCGPKGLLESSPHLFLCHYLINKLSLFLIYFSGNVLIKRRGKGWSMGGVNSNLDAENINLCEEKCFLGESCSHGDHIQTGPRIKDGRVRDAYTCLLSAIRGLICRSHGWMVEMKA